MTPPTIPGLRWLGPLGEGGMGVVWLAEDEALGRRAAVKFTVDRLATDSDARRRFLREARSMAAVEHPNVVRVYSFGEAEGAAYIVMEYVAGLSLAERLKQGPLPPAEALRIVRAVADALEAAWDGGLVHRDIKPSNILLDARGQVRVADFGLAKPIRGEGDASLTGTGAILGTPHYLAPEQARGRPVDFHADIYSLGVVLYEMATGARPFEGSTPLEVVARHLTEPLPSLRGRAPDDVAGLVEAMTAKDPAARPDSYATLRRRVEAAMTGRTEAHATVSTLEAPRTPRPWRPWAVAVLAAAAVAATIAGLSPPDPPPQPVAGELRIAVAPFHGPDEESLKEGRVMAALVQRAIAQRLPSVHVVPVEDAGAPVRDQASALALGRQLGVGLVVWGEAFALRGETEIQPSFTLVPRDTTPGAGRSLAAREKELALRARTPDAVVVPGHSANQIELRKTSAAGVGDLVLVMAGLHALYAQDKPELALRLLEQAPRTAETLRFRAEALDRMKRADEVRAALAAAVALDPGDADAWGALGDSQLEAGHRVDAVASYERAAATGRPFGTRIGVVHQGRLVQRERFRRPEQAGTPPLTDSGYLLVRDAVTGVVLERRVLPAPVAELRATPEGIEVVLAYPEAGYQEVFRLDALSRAGLSPRLAQRRAGVDAGRAILANFLPRQPEDRTLAVRGTRTDVPRTLAEAEAALRRAAADDPTQPWHPFWLGHVLDALGRREDAETAWAALYAQPFSATPHYEWAWMAADFETLRRPRHAERAYAEGARRRAALPLALPTVTLIEQLINDPVLRQSAVRAARDPRDVERARDWLHRVRANGWQGEGDALVAAAWAPELARRGDAAGAERERAVLARHRDRHLDFLQITARLDYLQQVLLAAVLTFMVATGLVLLSTRRRTAGSALAAVSAAQRRALIAAGVLALASFVPLAVHLRTAQGFTALPIGTPDAVGSGLLAAQLDEALAERPSPAGVFVAAVANHAAGRWDRARELYGRADATDPRVRRNREALERGGSPEPFTLDDLERMFSAPRRDSAAALLQMGRIRSELEIAPFPDALLLLAAVVLLAALLVAFAFVPAGRPSLVPSGDAARRLVPGLAHLEQGRPILGVVALGCVFLVGVAVTLHAVANAGQALATPGPATAAVLPSMARVFPLPDGARWAAYGAWVDGRWFWSAVALAAVTAATLHARRPRVPRATPPDDDVTRSRIA